MIEDSIWGLGNGQHKPYVKATRKEIEQRIKAAGILESLEWELPDIHWFFQKVFGIESRQTDRYLAHARAVAAQSEPLWE